MAEYRYPLGLPNPTDSQRHEMLREALTAAGRPEDYRNVIELLSPPPDITNYAPPGSLRGRRIGIIGGGLAGLSAAFELRKLGADITIYDALEDRIGGRVYTYYFDKDKKYFGELGPIRIPISHETTWYYINKFKLKTVPFVQRNPNAFIYVHNTRVRNDYEGRNIQEKIYPKYNLTEAERNTPWPQLYDYAINFALNNLPYHIRPETIKILPRYSPQYAQLISLNIRQLFEMLGLSQDAINLISSVDPFTGGFLYFSYSEYLSELYPVNFAFLYRVDGGNVNLPLAIYRSITSPYPQEYGNLPYYLLGNVKFKSGHYVNGIFKWDSKVVLQYRSVKSSQDLREVFDYVICAIPFTTLREVRIDPLFSNRKMQAIRELGYIDAMRALFYCNRRFWEEDTEYGRINGGISYTDLPIQSIIYPSDHALCTDIAMCSPKEPGVLAASYNFNLDAVRVGNMNEPRRTELIMSNVEEVHGLPRGYLDTVVEQVKIVHWNTEQWFKGAVSSAFPEQKSVFSYDVLRPEYNNKVFFAGEHTSATHAWMQGALYSGKLAANMLAYNSMFRE